MNWFSLLSIALRLVPKAVQAVNVIATEAHSGADKRKLAVDSVLIGSGVADVVLSPQDQLKSDAIAQLVGHSIDATVAAAKLGSVAQAAAAINTVTSAVASIGIAEGAR